MAAVTAEYTDLAEVLADMKYGDQPSAEVSEETSPDAPAVADEKESAATPDKVPAESAEETTTEPANDPDAEAKPAEGEAGEKDTSEDKSPPSKEGEPAKLIEIDGKEYTLEEVREMRDNGLRQSDYTRKAQEAAKIRKAAEERDALVAQIVADEAMKQMVAAHPEMLPHLLRDPENTKALLGHPEQVQALWDDYEVIATNPRLAERFTKQDPAAEDALAEARYIENINAVAMALDGAVDQMAKDFAGVDPDEVKSYILSLGGMPDVENPDKRDVAKAFERMFSLFFVQDGDAVRLEDRLIKARFKELHANVEAAKTAKESDAAAHNAEVDTKLKDDAPRTTPEGKAPAPAPVSIDDGDEKDVNEVIRGLLGY
jgi:hypothetical protein